MPSVPQVLGPRAAFVRHEHRDGERDRLRTRHADNVSRLLSSAFIASQRIPPNSRSAQSWQAQVGPEPAVIEIRLDRSRLGAWSGHKLPTTRHAKPLGGGSHLAAVTPLSTDFLCECGCRVVTVKMTLTVLDRLRAQGIPVLAGGHPTLGPNQNGALPGVKRY